MNFFDLLWEHKEETGLVFDVDGTLSVIVMIASEATVTEDMRALLVGLAEEYRRVQILTGREAADAKRIVGVPDLDYLGLHGAQWLPAGTDPASAQVDDRFVAWMPRAQNIVRALRIARWGDEHLGGKRLLSQIRLEDKAGCMLALHYRGVPNEERAERIVRMVAWVARRLGFRTRLAMKTLEILPPIPLGKREGIKRLVELSGASYVLYAGDGPTDRDAFDGLDDLVRDHRILGAVKVAVDSGELSPELEEAADISVRGVDGMRELMRDLMRDLRR